MDSEGGLDLSRLIGAALDLPRRKGKSFPCPGAEQHQYQWCTGLSAGNSACLLQHNLGSCCPSQVSAGGFVSTLSMFMSYPELHRSTANTAH